jgi:hypothetical protein
MDRLRYEDRIFKALRHFTGVAARPGSGAYKGGLLPRQCGHFLTIGRAMQAPAPGAKALAAAGGRKNRQPRKNRPRLAHINGHGIAGGNGGAYQRAEQQEGETSPWR